LFRLEHGAPGILDMEQTYMGFYASDAWRVTNRVTVNGGLRWEPFFGPAVTGGAISNFVLDNFRKGIRSTVFVNAPPGLVFPGDQGFSRQQLGTESPVVGSLTAIGVAWDVAGDGRTAVRSSYGVAYDFPTATYHYINASAAPYANRLRIDFPPGGFEDPYATIPGGDTHPLPLPPPRDAKFPPYGSYGSIDPNINSPRVQSWNVTVERQLGQAWGASVSYLGSYTDRLWNQVAINPGVFLGLGPCTLAGVSYPMCTTAANLDQRRALSLENPQFGQFFGPVDLNTDAGTQDYHGVKLSFRRRAATGISLNGNYTWSHCVGNVTPGNFNQISAGYMKPDDPSFDRGNCQTKRDHLVNMTAGYQTPQFSNTALRLVGIGLADFGYSQRAFGRVVERHSVNRPGYSGHGHPGSQRTARQSGARQSVRREDGG
jgi:hypothetical protein